MYKVSQQKVLTAAPLVVRGMQMSTRWLFKCVFKYKKISLILAIVRLNFLLNKTSLVVFKDKKQLKFYETTYLFFIITS